MPASSSSLTTKDVIRQQPKTDKEQDDSSTKVSSLASTSSWATAQDEERFPSANTRPTAKTLDGRLLCASTVAYEIRQPFFSGVGFQPHTQVKKITKGINSVLVGRLQDGTPGSNARDNNDLVIAFRGTNSALDWVQNVAANLRSVPSKYMLPKAAKIHSGFYQAAQSLLDPLKDVLKEVILGNDGRNGNNTNNPANVYLTGHSKGGSLATVVALLLHQDPPHFLRNSNLHIYTFGQARVGNADLVQFYNRNLLHHVSYENDLDLVPFLPPPASRNGTRTRATMPATGNDNNEYEVLWEEVVDSHSPSSSQGSSTSSFSSWEYQPVGERKYIDREGEIQSNPSRQLDRQRIRDMEALTLLRFETFRKAHSLSLDLCDAGAGDGSGIPARNYVSALVPELCFDEQESSSSMLQLS